MTAAMHDRMRTPMHPTTSSVERRPQVAALCLRETPEGLRVLLITSRDTGRWIVPKGWPMEGKTGSESAQEEAWEEAGVLSADFETEPLGHFDYDKRMGDGDDIPVQAQVYRALTHQMSDDFPEAGERTRIWVTPEEAARMVEETELQAILRRV